MIVTISQAGQPVNGGNGGSGGLPNFVFRGADGDLWTVSPFSRSGDKAYGAIASNPGSAMDSYGRTVAAARDQYNGVWVNWIQNGYWAGWQFGGGAVQGDPSVAAAPDHTFWIAARDAYNAYWLLSIAWNGRAIEGTFGTWVPLHGVFATDPAIAACPDGSIYVVGKDNYNALWSGRYIPGTGFQGFQLGGGVVKGAPSVTCGTDNAIYVSARDNANSNWIARVFGDTWTGWFNGGGISAIDPRIITAGALPSLVIIDNNGAAWRNAFTQGTTNGWQSWIRVGGVLTDIAPAAGYNSLWFMGKSQSGNLWLWSGDWDLLGLGDLGAGRLSGAYR
jgi:hypothetical protein